MERINLNIPSEARRRLRGVAKRLGRTQSEVARALLLEALDNAEREDFYRRVAQAQTPELREHRLRILAAFERLRGKAR